MKSMLGLHTPLRFFSLSFTFLGLGLIFSQSYLFTPQSVAFLNSNHQSTTKSDNLNIEESVVKSEVLDSSFSTMNINQATLNELMSLPGIGPKIGQKIIDHRPYSEVEDLLSRKIISNSLYEKVSGFFRVN